jgi:hypothetical protein
MARFNAAHSAVNLAAFVLVMQESAAVDEKTGNTVVRTSDAAQVLRAAAEFAEALREERVFIAISPAGYWGKGFTAEQAVAALADRAQYIVWSCPLGSRFNGDGGISFPGYLEKLGGVQEPFEVKRRGIKR